MKIKSYIILSICGIICVLSLVGIFVFYVDPYLQYHMPNENMAYNMDMGDFTYYNAGVAKSFSYDTIITGSSMSRSFLPSYIDQQFSCNSVKLSMAEARGKDFSILLPLVESNPNLQRVIIGLDTFAYNVDKDYSAYEKPMHLYDSNPFNDVLYLANMDGLLEAYEVLCYTANGGTTTTMDDYQNYVLNNTFARDKVVDIYKDNIPVVQSVEFDAESLRKTVIENLEQNLIPTIENNPTVDFVFYFPPYSIVKWALVENPSYEIECMRIIIEKLINYSNVSIYFYQGEQDVITNLEHYMDTIHFDSIVANQIVDYMAEVDNKLTVDNYENVLNEFEGFVRNYDYGLLKE